MGDWPVYVLEFGSNEKDGEDISWLLNWILGAFSNYGLQLSSSTPLSGQVIVLCAYIIYIFYSCFHHIFFVELVCVCFHQSSKITRCCKEVPS